MGIHMALGEFYRFAQHHAKGNVFDGQFMSYLQGFADIVAILHKCLLGQVRVEGFYETFALTTAINDHAFRIRGSGHCHTLADAVYESFFGERLYDT